MGIHLLRREISGRLPFGQGVTYALGGKRVSGADPRSIAPRSQVEALHLACGFEAHFCRRRRVGRPLQLLELGAFPQWVVPDCSHHWPSLAMQPDESNQLETIRPQADQSQEV